MHGLLREGEEECRHLTLGKYTIEVFYETKDEPCYGLIIQTQDDEFLVAGVNLRVEFSSSDMNRIGYIGQVWEGRFVDNQWQPIRMLNGDETYHHQSLRVLGREPKTGVVPSSKHAWGPQPKVGQQEAHTSWDTKQSVKTPGVYQVKTYLRD